ncbi:MAG: 5-formyltetrahydrofolate cyclo-ligase [Oscillospiraceae bacterium]|nr:5-formyltetrahydrofolate cyclo-ligase [Oscillospiraceae bacterium]
MRELKRALRKELISRRKEIPQEEKLRRDKSVFEQLKPLMERASAVFIYVSTEIEVDTRAAIDFCLEKKIPIACPVSGDEELEFFYINSTDELVAGRYGILEPKTRSRKAVEDENALCVVPALMTDGRGYRLGYGKGYYDRFLSRFAGKSAVVCYSDFVGEVPAEPHDKRADITITDKL